MGKSRHNEHPACIVLLSGGMDSAACVQYYRDQGINVRGLFIDFGQPARYMEQIAATRVASHYGIQLCTARLVLPRTIAIGEVKGRNAMFVMAALVIDPEPFGLIALGIHGGTPYYDCSELFLEDIRRVVDHYVDGLVRVDAPFLTWDKAAIYAYCKESGVPINLTYSCEAGTAVPCGECRSCRDREALNAC